MCWYSTTSMPVCLPQISTTIYNLREDSQDEDLSGFSRSPRLTHERRLPSVVETKGDESDNSVHLLPATRSLCNLLLTSFSNLVGLHGQSSTPQPLSLKEQSTPTATRVSTRERERLSKSR